MKRKVDSFVLLFMWRCRQATVTIHANLFSSNGAFNNFLFLRLPVSLLALWFIVLSGFVPIEEKSHNQVEKLFPGRLARWVGKISKLEWEETHRSCGWNNQDSQYDEMWIAHAKYIFLLSRHGGAKGPHFLLSASQLWNMLPTILAVNSAASPGLWLYTAQRPPVMRELLHYTTTSKILHLSFIARQHDAAQSLKQLTVLKMFIFNKSPGSPHWKMSAAPIGFVKNIGRSHLPAAPCIINDWKTPCFGLL